MNERQFPKFVLPILSFLGVLCLWHAASAAPGWNHFLFPAPLAVARRMAQLLESGVLFRHLGASLFRVLSGFGLAVLLAFPMGIALALLPLFSALARPLLDFVRQIPPLAVVPLLILGFGIGEASRIAVVVMASFFPVLLNVESGIRQVDRRLLEVGRALSFPPIALFRHIAFPSFFPYFLAGVRLALSYSWRSLIGAEIVAAASGIGYMIREAETLSRSDTILCGVIVLGCVGSLSDLALRSLSARLFPWSAPEGGA